MAPPGLVIAIDDSEDERLLDYRRNDLWPNK
jgi:hypothetical protein